MKGILGYHGSAPVEIDPQSDSNVIKEFLDNADDNGSLVMSTIYDSWLTANSFGLFKFRKTAAGLLVKERYDQESLYQSLCDNSDLEFTNIYLYKFKTFGGSSNVVFSAEQERAVNRISDFCMISDDVVLSEVTCDCYDLNGEYISSEVVEYIAATQQSTYSFFSTTDANDQSKVVLYRYNPQTDEVTCI